MAKNQAGSGYDYDYGPEISSIPRMEFIERYKEIVANENVYTGTDTLFSFQEEFTEFVHLFRDLFVEMHKKDYEKSTHSIVIKDKHVMGFAPIVSFTEKLGMVWNPERSGKYFLAFRII